MAYAKANQICEECESVTVGISIPYKFLRSHLVHVDDLLETFQNTDNSQLNGSCALHKLRSITSEHRSKEEK